LTFVDVPVAEPPLDTKQPGRGVTKVAVDLQWTNPDAQLATTQLLNTAQPALPPSPPPPPHLLSLMILVVASHIHWLCRDLTFVDVPVAQPPLDTKQPGRGVTKSVLFRWWLTYIEPKVLFVQGLDVC
jgi:hypothetical protein